MMPLNGRTTIAAKMKGIIYALKIRKMTKIKAKPMARAVWTKFNIKGNKLAFHIHNTYYDKDFFDQDATVSVNEEVQSAINISKKFLELIETGKIKNFRISYDIT
jgi:hypothetical protein